MAIFIPVVIAAVSGGGVGAIAAKNLIDRMRGRLIDGKEEVEENPEVVETEAEEQARKTKEEMKTKQIMEETLVSTSLDILTMGVEARLHSAKAPPKHVEIKVEHNVLSWHSFGKIQREK